jgi:N-acetylmuramoyl-L-alanine amidase
MGGARMGALLTTMATGRVSRIVVALAALACAGVVAAASHGSERTGVQRVRFGGDMRETRLVVELDRSTHAKISTDSPGSVVLSLPDVSVAAEQEGQGQGLVRAWSMSKSRGATKLTLTLNGPAEVRRRFLLSPSEGSPTYRYVVDLAAMGAPRPSTLQANRPQLIAARQPVEHRRKVVVIDAGHGGKDPGAHGAGTWEKTVTLQAAQSLKARLEKTGRYRVVLTRSSDEFVPLQTRVQIARSADADLFISMHADAGTDPSLRGATVYTLSDEGSDRAARKAIDERGYFLNVNLPGGDRSVNQILLDLTQRVTKNRSSVFAESLVERVGHVEPMSRRSHRNAGYVVLLAPDVPAVLLEMGFITNPGDEQALVDPERRTRLIDAVARSIDDYFSAPKQLASR